MTTRTFVTFCSLEHSILVRQSKCEELEEARRRIDLCLRPLAGEATKGGRSSARRRVTSTR